MYGQVSEYDIRNLARREAESAANDVRYHLENEIRNIRHDVNSALERVSGVRYDMEVSVSDLESSIENVRKKLDDRITDILETFDEVLAAATRRLTEVEEKLRAAELRIEAHLAEHGSSEGAP